MTNIKYESRKYTLGQKLIVRMLTNLSSSAKKLSLEWKNAVVNLQDCPIHSPDRPQNKNTYD